jgi:hypothetical protein
MACGWLNVNGFHYFVEHIKEVEILGVLFTIERKFVFEN